jgi:hypothetical protein
MTIQTGGNVGIGTTDPEYPLHVQNNNNILANFQSATNKGAISVRDNDTVAYISAENGRIGFGTVPQLSTSNLTILTSNNNIGIGTTSPTEKLHVVGNGLYSGGLTVGDSSADTFKSNGHTYLAALGNNVGIGTTSPNAKLEVADSIPIFRITGTRNTNWTVGQTMASLEYFSEDASGSSANSVRASINLVNEINVYGSTTGLSFSTKGDVAGLPIEAMRINASGKVGIGTTDPQAKLDVDGGIKMANDLTTASSSNVGTQRYRTNGNNSYVDMCMQTGASTYEWINIVQNNW